MTRSRKAFLHSLLALLLSISMLIGSTFAWFTDSVTTGSNVITTGTLGLEMYWTDDLQSGTWYNVEDPATNKVFNYDNWEPGYTEVRYLKLKNTGNLALNYQLLMTPVGAVGKLAEVIQVYYDKEGAAVNERGDLSGMAALGFLDRVMERAVTGNGTILAQDQVGLHPAGETVVTLAMQMVETAGNDYQDKSVGDGFTITALATQATYEQDSTGADYDADAKYLYPDGRDVASAPVTAQGGVTTAPVTLAGDTVTATVPAGVKLEDGAEELTLTVRPLDDTTSGITTVNDENLIPVDVHVEGVAADNTTPIVIDLGPVLPVGLNMGNYTLYHVEKEGIALMTYVASAAALTAHNTFTYDPATGQVSVALATFSEVALIAEEDAAWEGTVATAFAGGDGSAADPYRIANADQLAYMNKLVSNDPAYNLSGDDYGSKHYKLLSNVNLGTAEKDGGATAETGWYPIGYWKPRTTATLSLDGAYGPEAIYLESPDHPLPAFTATVADSAETTYEYGGAFKGTFDGAGFAVSNVYQNTWVMKGSYEGTYWNHAMGLFGYVYGGTVKNLTVKNLSSDGEFTPTGVIAAYAAAGSSSATFKNIAILNCNPRVYNTGNGGIVGVAGNTADGSDKVLSFENITVDNTNVISALWGSWDVACGGIAGMFRGDGKVNMTNCHVSAQIDAYNDVCGNYQYYWYRYSGMLIGSIRKHVVENGYTMPDTSGITTVGCSVHFGEWNQYYYCELVANTLASYTHDHQFSRLTPIGALTEISEDGGQTFKKTGNFLLTDANGSKTCYHIMRNAEGGLYRHFHDVVDDTNKEIYETVNGVKQLKENNQIIYLPFNQLFSGYGWGVKHVSLKEFTDKGGNVVEILDGASNVKFTSGFAFGFLPRVGNQNAVALGDLFDVAPKMDADGNVKKDDSGNTVYHSIVSTGVAVSVSKLSESMSISYTVNYNTVDWTKSTIDFDGTGVVKVTIQDYNLCAPTTIYLEVVDATNTTTASFSGNTVLLNDVSTSSALSASGVVYGNGFTVNLENAPISEKNGAVFHLYDGAILKNLGIVGKEFTTVATNVNDTNYGVSTVRAWGTVTIENCYISGCRAPVSVTGTELTIKDSVIANGIYANIDFRSGILNLHNVTTVNEPHAVNGTTVVGLGIVGNMTASAGRQLNVTGTLTQYNWVSQNDCSNIKASGVSSIYNKVFTDAQYASLRYTYEGTTYVNTGILSLCSDFGASSVTGISAPYSGMDVTATISSVTVNGYVWALAQAGTLSDADMSYHDKAYSWTPTNQGTSYIPGAFAYAAAGLETDGGMVQIEYENGSSYTLKAATLKALLTATKYNEPLSYTITMNGTDYTDKDIVFDGSATQVYTIIYTVTDDLIYDQQGKRTGETYEVTKELKVYATVTDKTAAPPSFIFYYGTNGSAGAGTPHTAQPTYSYAGTIKKVGETFYIMPNASATAANAVGSQTVDGVTVYYPIVDGINVRSGSSTDYDFTRYYPVFKAVEISDNGTEYTYSGTKEMPATVAWVSATIDSGNGASALNDGFGLYNNQYLCKIQKKAGDAESGGTSVVKYSYTALDGNTYYYYVGYRFYDEDEGGVCVTPDTMVTLADGTQKRVDALTGDELLLVWNHQTGSFDTVPVAYIVDHGKQVAEREITHLYFSDGNEIRMIGEHVFFDTTLNRYVALTAENVNSFIGHTFVAADDSLDGIVYVELTDVEHYVEETMAYEVVSYQHLTCFTNNVLSTSAYLDKLLNIFEMQNDTLSYSAEAIQQDVETYGLYTYADFKGLISEEAFELYNAPYLKIAVGKGYITWDDILDLIDIFFNAEVQPIG